MFEIGRYVVYRAEGVCRISDIRVERFGALPDRTYYILTPLNDEKSTVFVPVDNGELVGMMRPLLSAEEISGLAEKLKGKTLEWIPNSRARSAYYRELLAGGNREDLIRLVNTLTAHEETTAASRKKTSSTEEYFLRTAIKMLYREFSVTAGLRAEEDILPLLRGELGIKEKENADLSR